MKTSSYMTAVVFALVDLIDARYADFPQTTASVDPALYGWTPKPTAAPELLKKLSKRQITGNDDDSDEETTVFFAPDQTCGYVSGRPGASLTCAPDYQCVLFTASASLTGNLACCNTETCGVRLACIGYDEYYSSSACDDACNLDAYTLKCVDSALPYCNTVSFSSDIYDFWCNNVDLSTVQSATTAYSGQTGRSFSPYALTENESTTVEFDFEPDTSGAGPEVTDDGDSDDNDDNSNGDDDDGGSGNSGRNRGGSSNGGGDDDGDSGTPVGPIVGGVVGGVAAIGLGALGLWLFFRNKKKKQAAAAAGQSSPSVAPTYQQSPPPGMAQPYNPHQSYYDPKFAAAAGAQPYQPYNSQQQPPPPQQQQQPGGFYPMGNAPPASNTASSPTMTHYDPNVSSPSSAIYPSGFSQSPPPPVSSVSPNPHGVPPSYQQPGGGGGGFVHEAPSRPDETHRGGVHEIG